MALSKIKDDYKNGIIDKGKYARLMFQEYVRLFDFRKAMMDSNVKCIKINEQGVIFTIGNDAGGYEIDMEIGDSDIGAIPVTIMSFGSYEEEELKIFNRIAEWISKRNGIFFDIGANLGWYTLNICKQYGNITAYAFEPAKNTFQAMQRNLGLNGINNCLPCNLGFSAEKSKAIFYFNSEESGASSLRNLRGNDKTYEMQCDFVKMDDYIKENNVSGVDFIKCDVEGAELLVYQGGIESIRQYKPVIFSEMLRKWSAKFNYHPNDIIKLLGDVGYNCYVIHNDRLQLFTYVDDNTIETNYFFLHPDKHAELMRDLVL